uniref:Uncharacterized protein n=1 Tax=Heterorhabditis bacteriophora TaxID=37862 RepID=A0A1I7WW48_HETBA
MRLLIVNSLIRSLQKKIVVLNHARLLLMDVLVIFKIHLDNPDAQPINNLEKYADKTRELQSRCFPNWSGQRRALILGNDMQKVWRSSGYKT